MRATLKIVLLCGVLFAGLGGVAKASTVIESGGSFPYQRWIDRANVPTPRVTLRVVETTCPNGEAVACTVMGDYTIWMAPLPFSRGTFLHELGHNWDYYAMTEADRQAFLSLVGGETWHEPALGEDAPDELFAEAYRSCAVGWHHIIDPYDQPPLGRQGMRSACYLIRH